jgi:hypothetical protein
LIAPFDPFCCKRFFLRIEPNEKGLKVQIPWDFFGGISFELLLEKVM